MVTPSADSTFVLQSTSTTSVADLIKAHEARTTAGNNYYTSNPPPSSPTRKSHNPSHSHTTQSSNSTMTPRHRESRSSRAPRPGSTRASVGLGGAAATTTNNNNSPTCKSHTKRRVRKGPVTIQTTKLTVHEVPHYTDYTQTEINSIWFTQQEINRTINECKETVQCMQDGIPLSEDDDQAFTTRGLEYMTTSGFDITTSSLDAVKLVLQEQARQRDEQDEEALNPDLLAQAMEGISMHRLRIAHLAAMKDARAVYGEGKFKTTAQGPPMRSRSLQRRSGGGAGGNGGSSMRESLSAGNLRRPRRGSRGPLGGRRSAASTRALSAPSSSAAQTATNHQVGLITRQSEPRRAAAAAVAAEFGL